MTTAGLSQHKMGIGTWSWGDRLFWGFGKEYQEEDLRSIFQYCVEKGVTLFDTAEVYGQGRSEKFVGKFAHEVNKPVQIATKFMPFPWRLSSRSLDRACEKSLRRLQVESVFLYQIHMPAPPLSVETWMEAMLRVHEAGLVKQIGVSNYSADWMKRAYTVLNREGVHLASNQVEYHLLDRSIEKNGVLQLAKDLGISLIAYSPIAMGALSGKYNEQHIPAGYRGRKYNQQYFKRIKPLLLEMGRIGVAHDGKSMSQVAINWVMAKGLIPIPGAKTLQQVQENIETTAWRLTSDEIAILDELSDRVAPEA